MSIFGLNKSSLLDINLPMFVTFVKIYIIEWSLCNVEVCAMCMHERVQVIKQK